MGVRNQLHDSVRTKACTADGGTYSAQQSMALSAKAGQREPGAPGKIDALMGKPACFSGRRHGAALQQVSQLWI